MSEQLNLSKGDTLSTVLLIAVFFFIVYYLTKPKTDRECFGQRKKKCIWQKRWQSRDINGNTNQIYISQTACARDRNKERLCKPIDVQICN